MVRHAFTSAAARAAKVVAVMGGGVSATPTCPQNPGPRCGSTCMSSSLRVGQEGRLPAEVMGGRACEELPHVASACMWCD